MKKFLVKDLKKLNNAVAKSAPGFYKDSGWNGKDKVIDALAKVCEANSWEWEILENKYRQDDKGNLTAKTWKIRVFSETHEAYGTIIASGAGTVSDPLSRYDIVAYF
jgi:hypothetical protein